MCDGQTRSQACAIAPVEAEKLIRDTIVQRARQSLSDPQTHKGRAKTLALDAQKGDLVEGIDRTQTRIELQPVDDLRRLA